MQLIQDFLKIGSKDKNIKVTLVGFKDEYKIENSTHVTST